MSENHKKIFLKKINKNSKNSCWNWKGYINPSGYGEFFCSKKNKHIRAHRLSYSLFKGEIPEGMFVCHTCDNPSCVNPDHLWVGTPKDNVQDMIKKGRGSKPPLHREEDQHKSKLTKKDVLKIIEIYYKGMSQNKISKIYKVNVSTINIIFRKKSWKKITKGIID